MVALLALLIIVGLFIGGAQPAAVNLIPEPWDKLAHGIVFAMLAWAIGLASGLTGWLRLVVSILGALLVGMVRGLTSYFLPPASEASMYMLMVLVLLFRPRGLFGERISKFE